MCASSTDTPLSVEQITCSKDRQNTLQTEQILPTNEKTTPEV